MTGIPDTLDYAMANEAEPRECVTMRCTRSPTPYQATYLITNNPCKLWSMCSISWSLHIQAIINKATKMLNFVKSTSYHAV